MRRRARGWAAARPGLWILAGYLGLTLIPAALAVRDPATSLTFAAHVAGLAIAVQAARRLGRAASPEGGGRGRIEPTLAWLPVLAVPLLYGELPLLMAGIGSGYHDPAVQRWELALFGGTSPAQTFAPALAAVAVPAVTLVISEVLHAGYLSFYAIIYLPVVILFARRDRVAFGTAVTGLTTVFALTYLTFVLFPVQGPRYLWPAPPEVPTGPLRALTLRVLEGGSSRGTAFPSAHVAIAVMQSLFALRWDRPFGIVFSVSTILLSLGAVYGGYHYAVDVMAGAAVGLAAGYLLRRVDESTRPETAG